MPEVKLMNGPQQTAVSRKDLGKTEIKEIFFNLSFVLDLNWK